MNKRLRTLLCFALILIIALPSGVFANEGDWQENFEAKITKYFYRDNNDDLVFDKEKALLNNEDNEFIEIAEGILDYGSNYDDNIIKPRFQLAVYGNWCGPEYTGGTAIDNLDKGCKQHDLCYGNKHDPKKGYHSCYCDEEFHDYLKRGHKNKIFGSGTELTTSWVIRGWLAEKTTFRGPSGGSFSCRLV